MKCELCNEKVETHFLGKLKGTYVKADGKQKPICDECQGKHDMDEIKEEIS